MQFVTEYGYDAYGQRVSIRDAIGSQKGADGKYLYPDRVTEFAYDKFGQQIKRTLPAVTTGGRRDFEKTGYTKYGDLDWSTDFNWNDPTLTMLGAKVDYTYDWELTAPPADKGLDLDLGRVAQVTWKREGQTDPEETQAHTYDPYGRPDKVTETKGAVERVTDTDYDVEGRTIRVVRPEGVIDYTYDQATGRLATMSTQHTGLGYGYDVFGRLRTVTENQAGRHPRAARRPAGDVVRLRPDGQRVQGHGVRRGGRSAGNHEHLPTRPGTGWRAWPTRRAGVGVGTFTYTRRADGQVSKVVETGVALPDGKPAVDTTLTNEAVTTTDTTAAGGPAADDYVITYTLDRVGNRLERDRTGSAPETVVPTYKGRDQVTQEAVTGGSTPGSVTPGYDANGSLKSEGGARTRSQVYDLRGRLVSATVSGVTSVYTYTPDGIRSSGVEGDQPVRYLVDALSPSGYAQAVEERTTAGLFVASVVYGAGQDPIITNRQGQATGLYLADAHSGT